MEVCNIIIEDIAVASNHDRAYAKATIIELEHPEWVSLHRHLGQRQYGPVDFLERRDDNPLPESITSFPLRELPFDMDKGIILYRDKWTVPDCCLFMLIFPLGYSPTEFSGGVENDELFSDFLTDDNRLGKYCCTGASQLSHSGNVINIKLQMGFNEKRTLAIINEIESTRTSTGPRQLLSWMRRSKLVDEIILSIFKKGLEKL